LQSQAKVGILLAMTPAEKLLKAFGDSRSSVAARFNVSTEAVRLWLKNGIPADRALDAEEATRGTDFAITALEVLEHSRAQRVAA
jgi:transposase